MPDDKSLRPASFVAGAYSIFSILLFGLFVFLDEERLAARVRSVHTTQASCNTRAHSVLDVPHCKLA